MIGIKERKRREKLLDAISDADARALVFIKEMAEKPCDEEHRRERYSWMEALRNVRALYCQTLEMLEDEIGEGMGNPPRVGDYYRHQVDGREYLILSARPLKAPVTYLVHCIDDDKCLRVCGALAEGDTIYWDQEDEEVVF